MTEEEMKSKITQAHIDGYNRGYAKAKAEIKQLGERCNQLLKDKGELTDRCEELQEQNSELFNTIALQEQQIEKMKYTLNKIIETVHNDRIDGYGERLVLINNFANDVL